ncbi:hypothetical protein CP556_09665 [Natrinema sp. CBA1119]|uniref:DUF7521 family protein n=1 Tax=Natrinema sp. CBA1119 TaxID=1608465 RepID=UPI000BF91C99|nr:hypothetical protein [Natrinema sp. CBA1119]PGF16353.1 hypothetical protein CP556_09665 [Natrinema sp. CBA1119]
MVTAPLQLWEASPAEWVATFVQATDVLSALIGLFIAYQAYRGYRRNDSRPMLVIAVGFLFALAVPFLLVVLYVALPFVSESLVAVLSQASQVSGLLAILYALRMPV